MAEPTTVNYPTSYEDNNSLLGPLEERQIAVVKTSITVAELQITFEEPLTGLTGPLFIVFEGGEIWFVEADGITVADGDTIISLDSISQRGYHNSILQPHNAGEEAYFTAVCTHLNQMKKAIIALQQNGFLLGDSTARATYESGAIAGEGWLETNTGKVYYCFSAGTFTWVNRISHSDLTGLADDDHDAVATYGYDTDGRADSWHTGLTKSHINSGDDHDHFSSGEGIAVLRVYGGNDASKGSPSFAGHLYFSEDTAEGGTLFISHDGIVWDKISGAPTGAIAAYAGACPSGWTRYTNLDSKYIFVDNTSPGSSGGSHTHTHLYSVTREHYHGVTTVTTSGQTNPGSHSHQVEVSSGSGPHNRLHRVGDYTDSESTTYISAHTHGATIPATASDNLGVTDAETDSENIEPPYQEVVWCKKT